MISKIEVEPNSYPSSPKTLGFWITMCLFIFLIGSAFIVFWKIPFFDYRLKTDANRISAYGSFITGIVSTVTLVLVVYAYKATQNQIRLTQNRAFGTVKKNNETPVIA